jgi:hypothetical protein
MHRYQQGGIRGALGNSLVALPVDSDDCCMGGSESAVIVPIPEAEPLVGEFRASLDGAARWGVPAHVTVIYPFLAPDHLGAEELRMLGEAVASVPRFDVVFSEVCWFGDKTVWLAPDEPDGFRAMIDAVWSAFPACPPYGGAFATSVPHLTIGHEADRAALSAAEAAISVRLPVSASVSVAHLFQRSDVPGGWHSVAELPLG